MLVTSVDLGLQQRSGLLPSQSWHDNHSFDSIYAHNFSMHSFISNAFSDYVLIHLYCFKNLNFQLKYTRIYIEIKILVNRKIKYFVTAYEKFLLGGDFPKIYFLLLDTSKFMEGEFRVLLQNNFISNRNSRKNIKSENINVKINNIYFNILYYLSQLAFITKNIYFSLKNIIYFYLRNFLCKKNFFPEKIFKNLFFTTKHI